MQPGNIVEYIDKQKILCAVILETADQRLRLLSENTREVILSPQRLSHHSKARIDLAGGRDKTLQILKTASDRRSVLSDQIDIKSLWDVLKTEEEWIDLPTMTGLVFPCPPDADHESAVVRAFFKNRLYFKFNTDSFLPYTEEQVLQAESAAEKEKKRKQLIAEGVAWLKSAIQPSKPSGAPPLMDHRGEITGILKEYYLFGKDSESHLIAKTILTEAGAPHPDEVFRLLVKAGIFRENENLDIHLYRVPVQFPEPVLKCVSEKSGITFEGEYRKDLRSLSLLTIDGQSTLDFDDALSIEDKGSHILLGVHISDVGHYIRKGDAIDQEALFRASSIYMPDQTIPMIPAELSENLCSLMEGQQRPAISIMIRLSPTGEVVGYDIFPSVVTVNRQLTYTDAALLVESDPALALLHAVACRYRRKRLDEGAVHISLPEVTVRIDDKESPGIVRMDRESPSRMLISEVMILANAVMARFLMENRMPAVFRSQPAPKDRLYQGDSGSLFQNWMQRKVLNRFVLGTMGERHSGLGLNAYVTATSPIRKYYDLITQRQIRAVLGLEVPYSEQEVQGLLQKLEAPMSYVPKIQYMRNRYWLLKYLETRVGKKEEAIVIGKRKDGYQILLPAYMIECFMPQQGNIRLKPEDYLHVTLQYVNSRKDDLSVYMG